MNPNKEVPSGLYSRHKQLKIHLGVNNFVIVAILTKTSKTLEKIWGSYNIQQKAILYGYTTSRYFHFL